MKQVDKIWHHTLKSAREFCPQKLIGEDYFLARLGLKEDKLTWRY